MGHTARMTPTRPGHPRARRRSHFLPVSSNPARELTEIGVEERKPPRIMTPACFIAGLETHTQSHPRIRLP